MEPSQFLQTSLIGKVHCKFKQTESQLTRTPGRHAILRLFLQILHHVVFLGTVWLLTRHNGFPDCAINVGGMEGFGDKLVGNPGRYQWEMALEVPSICLSSKRTAAEKLARWYICQGNWWK